MQTMYILNKLNQKSEEMKNSLLILAIILFVTSCKTKEVKNNIRWSEE